MPELQKKPEIEFSRQVSTLRRELMKVNDYPDMTAWIFAKHEISKENLYIESEFKWDDVIEIVMFASYVGTLIRLAYYKYVHKLGFDPRALWDAIVLEYTFGEVFMMQLDTEVRKEPLKSAINKTRYPEWTRIGLLGGSTSEMKRLGEEFSEWMEGLT